MRCSKGFIVAASPKNPLSPPRFPRKFPRACLEQYRRDRPVPKAMNGAAFAHFSKTNIGQIRAASPLLAFKSSSND
jgi:hypothetical protein